ncbi:hypothetical protein ABK040_008237 [Willaertia magna]
MQNNNLELLGDLSSIGLLVLNTSETEKKVEITLEAERLFKEGKIKCKPNKEDWKEPPTIPARPENVKIVQARFVNKRGCGSLHGRIALVHSICHMESYAIDLSWDIICRFSNIDYLPDEFFEDWFGVAVDESRHFTMLNKRLKELGSYYGELESHDGLWKSAMGTSHSLLLRLCILHCIHEARGLDVTPNNIEKLAKNGDKESSELLTIIYNEEIDHVRKGVKWFKYCCKEELKSEKDIVTDNDVLLKFHDLVRSNKHFGKVKPPYNEEARLKAGFTKEWYEPTEDKEESNNNEH